MIFDKLERSGLYHALNRRLAEALRYVSEVDPAIADGVYPLGGEELVARVQTYTTQAEQTQRWESHRAFVDVQVVLSGEEHIIYAPTENVAATTEYDPAKDLIRYDDDAPGTARLTLRPGDFAIFFPDDVHKPGVAITTPAMVHKIVMKVPVW